MLWNIHGYPRKSAGNRIKAAKQDTSSQPAPTICHCSAMMLHLAGFEAAQKRWQGSAPEAQLFAWICLVVPWRWHRRFGGWKPELGRRLSELVRACPSLSELVHVQCEVSVKPRWAGHLLGQTWESNAPTCAVCSSVRKLFMHKHPKQDGQSECCSKT